MFDFMQDKEIIWKNAEENAIAFKGSCGMRKQMWRQKKRDETRAKKEKGARKGNSVLLSCVLI